MSEDAIKNTKNSKITIIIIVLVLILLIACGIICMIIYNGTSKVNSYFADNSPVSPIYYQVSDQVSVNNKLDRISNDSSYTLDNAYVELNPYGISPLSGIIIFQTKDEEQIRVYINNKYVTTMEASKKHVIPIYGLYEDFENSIRIEGNNLSKDYILKTDKSNIEYPLEVKKSVEVTDDIYFVIASYKTHLTGWDREGKLRFYLVGKNSMDVEFLNNGHFLIGVPQGQNGEQYIGFVEMDFLGKIYNYYTLQNGYSFDFQILKNGNIMVPGGDVPVYFKHQMITEINPSNGSVVSSLDIYDVVKSIDPNFNEKALGPSATRNGFWYDENSGEIVVSFRNINTIWSFNYKTSTLNWVLTDPNNEIFKDDVWKKYLVTTDSGRYPLGQHSPQLVDGNLLYFNNGYDRYSINFVSDPDDSTTRFKDAYSDLELLSIDPETHQAITLWKYDDDKKLLSIKFGYSRIFDNNHKFMDFGYILKDSYRSNKNSIRASEASPDNIYTLILELDENDNIIFEATSEEGKYRAFRHSLYSESTDNTSVSTLNMYNTIKDDKLDESSYKKINLEGSVDWINSLEFTKNTFTTDYNIKEDDSIKLYLLNKSGKIYILNYKDSNSSQINRIFNISLPAGDYALFIDIDGTIYNTHKVYSF